MGRAAGALRGDDRGRRDRLDGEIAVEVPVLVDSGSQRVADHRHTLRWVGLIKITTPVGGGVVVERTGIPCPHAGSEPDSGCAQGKAGVPPG